MSGYDSYLNGFKPAPQHTREVLYPYFGCPLCQMLRDRGVLVESERRGAKILSAADGAKSYRTEDGGIAEVLTDKYSGASVVVIVPPELVKDYRDYQAPLPFWAWSMG